MFKKYYGVIALTLLSSVSSVSAMQGSDNQKDPEYPVFKASVNQPQQQPWNPNQSQYGQPQQQPWNPNQYVNPLNQSQYGYQSQYGQPVTQSQYGQPQQQPWNQSENLIEQWQAACKILQEKLEKEIGLKEELQKELEKDKDLLAKFRSVSRSQEKDIEDLNKEKEKIRQLSVSRINTIDGLNDEIKNLKTQQSLLVQKHSTAIQQKEQELRNAKKTIDDQNSTIGMREGRIDQLNLDKQNLTTQLADLVKKNQSFVDQIAALKRQCEDKDVTINDLEIRKVAYENHIKHIESDNKDFTIKIDKQLIFIGQLESENKYLRSKNQQNNDGTYFLTQSMNQLNVNSDPQDTNTATPTAIVKNFEESKDDVTPGNPDYNVTKKLSKQNDNNN